MEYVEDEVENMHASPDADIDFTSTTKQRLPSYGSLRDFQLFQQTDENLIEQLMNSAKENDVNIEQKIQALESIDITVQIISFKIYEATHEFKQRIEEVQNERHRILVSIENRSELSLILNDLDKKITELENELDKKIKDFHKEKLDLQTQGEALMIHLDEDILQMQNNINEIQLQLDVQINALYKTQIMLINKKYAPQLEQLRTKLLNYEKLQLSGWKIETSEMKLSEVLEEHGLKFTPSGKLLTKSGSYITFEEAQKAGYFKDINLSLEKIVKFFQERDKQQKAFEQISPPGPPEASLSEGDTVETKMSSEDSKYLKQYLGRPLTLALAEIVEKQPRDPIHYLGHYLFKYRYNQEIEEIQKREIDELTEQRKAVAKERWKKFIEEEARNAVLEMILRAEQEIYRNELKRIEMEQMMAEEEESGGGEDPEYKELLEEARDKFE